MDRKQIIYRDIAELTPYENNPRDNDKAVDAVAASIKEFHFQNPIIVDKDGVIVAGHTRLKAAIKLGLKKVPVIVADDLTDEQVKAFRLADNKTGEIAEWDFEKLEKELRALDDIDMGQFGFEEKEEELEGRAKEAAKKLADRFVVPPFSTLDRRAGYWTKRKEQWNDLGIRSKEGRDDNLMNAGALCDWAENFDSLGAMAPSTSVFDPVLCEVVYRWFSPEGGAVFDPFAGGSVRGITAEILGRHYTGIDLRPEQIESNEEQAKEIGVAPKWIVDDSLNADKHVKDGTQDLVFTCPPYADLEVYSDDARDISNMDQEDFERTYTKILTIAARKLKKNRFMVVVISDVRDKNGFYRGLVELTKQALQQAGLRPYNDMILLDPIGTAGVRAARQFNGGKKVTKVHQNVVAYFNGEPEIIKTHESVLVYFDGDPQQIKVEFPPIEFDPEALMGTEDV